MGFLDNHRSECLRTSACGSGSQALELPILHGGDPAILSIHRALSSCEPSRKRLVPTGAAPLKLASGSNVLFLALGGIGDTVLSFAAVRQLRELIGDCRLVGLAMWRQSAELLDDIGVFDEVLHHHFQLESVWRSLRLLGRLRLRRFDASVQAFPANRFEYNLAHWFIGAKRRIGHNYLRGSSLTYLRWLLTDKVSQTEGTHCIDENVKLLDVFGRERTPHSAETSLGPLPVECLRFAERLVKEHSGPIVGIHAGSSSYKNLDAKRWPVERFAELCSRAYEELSVTPLLFGSESDRTLNATIHARCRVARVVEAPTIRHTAAVIQRCTTFVSNDSAPAHVASALSIPTIMLVGPTDPAEVRPRASGSCVVPAPMPCAPCFRVSREALKCTHPNRYACMRAIDVETVLERVRVVLADRETPTGSLVRRKEEHDESVMFDNHDPVRVSNGLCNCA